MLWGAFFMIMLSESVLAQSSAISLYAIRGTRMVSNQNIGCMETDTVGIYFVKDQGYELGRTVEFAMQISSPLALFMGANWSPQIYAMSDGILTSGKVLVAQECMGIGQEVVYIGEVYVWYWECSVIPPLPFTLRVVETDFYNGPYPPGIYASRCDPENTFESVLGGTFYFNCESCAPTAAKLTSWGAIKTLFN